jgi:ribosomal protein S20
MVPLSPICAPTTGRENIENERADPELLNAPRPINAWDTPPHYDSGENASTPIMSEKEKENASNTSAADDADFYSPSSPLKAVEEKRVVLSSPPEGSLRNLQNATKRIQRKKKRRKNDVGYRVDMQQWAKDFAKCLQTKYRTQTTPQFDEWVKEISNGRSLYCSEIEELLKLASNAFSEHVCIRESGEEVFRKLALERANHETANGIVFINSQLPTDEL